MPQFPSSLHSADKFRCAFCGLVMHVVSDENGPVGLVHEQPMCKTFDENDPVGFMRLQNAKTLS